MKIIRVWSLYCGGDWSYYYDRVAVLQMLAEIAADVKQQDNDYTGIEAATAICFYAPIRDGVTLPDDPSDLYLCEDDDWEKPRFLDCEHTDISMEHEFPQEGVITVDGDGTISVEMDGPLCDHNGYLARWRERGWNGVVEE